MVGPTTSWLSQIRWAPDERSLMLLASTALVLVGAYLQAHDRASGRNRLRDRSRTWRLVIFVVIVWLVAYAVVVLIFLTQTGPVWIEGLAIASAIFLGCGTLIAGGLVFRARRNRRPGGHR